VLVPYRPPAPKAPRVGGSNLLGISSIADDFAGPLPADLQKYSQRNADRPEVKMGVLLLLLVWCLAFGSAIICAGWFYGRHRRARPDRGRQMPALAYALVLLIGAVIGYPLGVSLGVAWACHPPAGNLCGLVGVFLVGPLASALAIVLVGSLILLVPSDRET
jgi:hypothetical protein